MKLFCSPTPTSDTTHQQAPPETECLLNSALVEQMPEAVTDSLGYLGSWIQPDSTSADPKALELPEAKTLANHVAPGQSHQPDTTARSSRPDKAPAPAPSKATKVAGSLKDGRPVGGVSREKDLGWGTAAVGAEVDLLAAQASGTLGLTRTTDAGDFGALVRGGIDLGWDGLQSLTGKVEGTLAGIKAGVGGGFTNDVSTIEEKDGKFEVTWSQGVAASATAGKGELGGDAEGAVAQTLTRTFTSRAEAEAFRDRVGEGPMPTRQSSEQVDAMKVGEVFDHGVELQLGGKGSTLAIAGMSGGLETKFSKERKIEKVADNRVRVTASGTTGADLKGGVGSVLSAWEGVYGGGREHDDTLEFDFSKPGVREAYDAYMRGEPLPEALEGIDRGQGQDLSTRHWGTSSWAGTDTITTDNGTASGTYYDGDISGTRVRGHSKTDHTRIVPGGIQDVAKEHHELKADSIGERSVYGTIESTYEGRAAAAYAADHLSVSDELGQTMARHGVGHDSYKVSTFLDGNTVQEAGHAAASLLAGQKGAPLRTYESQVGDYLPQFAEQALFDPMNNLATTVAELGRDGVELITQNVSKETTQVEHSTTGLGDIEKMKDISRRLNIAENNGGLASSDRQSLAWDIAEMKMILGADVTAIPEAQKNIALQLSAFDERMALLGAL